MIGYTLKALFTLGLLISIAWFIKSPDYEPAGAAVASLAALLGTFVIERKKNQGPNLRQIISSSSFGIQAGGDIGNIRIDSIKQGSGADKDGAEQGPKAER